MVYFAKIFTAAGDGFEAKIHLSTDLHLVFPSVPT